MEAFDRRELLSRSVLLLAAPGVLMATGCGTSPGRPLTPIFQNWIITLHPAIERHVNADSAESRRGCCACWRVDVADFEREAKSRSSSWDIYVGMTPWIDMARLIDASAVEPWNGRMSSELMGDLVLKLRTEATVGDDLYSWPFLVDVTMQAWNGELVERAGMSPRHAPSTWDEYIANARAVVQSGAAPYGCTFDPRGWRSLAPIAHSLAADTYTEDGLFDFTHPGVVEALEVMKRMLELSHPDVLEPEAALASINPDEAAFAAQTVAYSVKYQNAHVRFASSWVDPTRLGIGALPANGGRGGSVFWTTGIALLRYGERKREAAAYAEALTHDALVWLRSLGTSRDAAGQLGAFESLPGWSTPSEPWLAAWVSEVADALQTATVIRPHVIGDRQFTVARPFWEEYLRGSTSSAPRALARAMAAARAEARRVSA